MSAPAPRTPLARVIERLPVAVAFAVHGIAQQRAWLWVPLGLLLLLWTALRPPRAFREGGLALSIPVGALGGLALFALLGTRSRGSPLPPLLEGAVVGVLLANGAYAALTEATRWAWMYGWMAAALSTYVRGGPALQVALVALVLSGLLAAAAEVPGLLRRRRTLVAWLLLALFAVPSTMAIATVDEGLFDPLLARMLEAWEGVSPLPKGLALSEGLKTMRSGRITSEPTPVFEVEGALPERLRVQLLDTLVGDGWSASERLLTAANQEGSASQTFTLKPYATLGTRIPAPPSALPKGEQTLNVAALLLGRTVRGAAVEVGWKGSETLEGVAPPNERDRALPEGLAEPLQALALPLLNGVGPGGWAEAEALSRHFHTEHTYSLETDLTGASHPLVKFIRERRSGWCVHFAGALTVLLRARGHAARMVTGFVLDEGGRQGAALVRERDAHAWVEVWDEAAASWQAFDPTPMQSRDAALETHSPAWLRVLRDGFDRLWLRLSLDPAGLAIELFSSPLVISLVLLLAARAVWSRRKRWFGGGAQEVRSERGPAELATRRARFDAHLLRHGLETLPTETDDELLARLALRVPAEVQGSAAAFIEAWRRRRFGGEQALPPLDAALDAWLATAPLKEPRG